ncbi:MAG: DUF2244 domain-containing protein [Gammaproteobacteria bacterium]
MVTTQFDDHECARRFVIRPNCSLPWRQVVRFYLSVLAVSMGIAVAFALQGAWMVLPFAGLEMLVLGAALYIVARRSSYWQQIVIQGDNVDFVEHGPGTQHRESFKRAWVRIELVGPAIRGHPSRLTIGSHGRCVEIGGCLNEEDKRYLADELRQAVRPTR